MHKIVMLSFLMVGITFGLSMKSMDLSQSVVLSLEPSCWGGLDGLGQEDLEIYRIRRLRAEQNRIDDREYQRLMRESEDEELLSFKSLKTSIPEAREARELAIDLEVDARRKKLNQDGERFSPEEVVEIRARLNELAGGSACILQKVEGVVKEFSLVKPGKGVSLKRNKVLTALFDAFEENAQRVVAQKGMPVDEAKQE